MAHRRLSEEGDNNLPVRQSPRGKRVDQHICVSHCNLVLWLPRFFRVHNSMEKFILGTKIAMSRRFRDDGTVIPVTVIEAGPCVVTAVRPAQREGFQSVQLGFGKAGRQKKPQVGHTKGLGSFRYLREFQVAQGVWERGKTVDANVFQVGDIVHVVGTTKGKGYAGVVKRHGFSGSPATHGHKDQLRMPGSIGSTAPQRVLKGRRMAGRMGGQRVTIRKLEVIEVNPEKHELVVKGAVPGARQGLLVIRGRSLNKPS